MAGIHVSIAPEIVAERWLRANGYAPSYAFGAFRGYRAKTLGVGFGNGLYSGFTRFIREAVSGLKTDERQALGVFVFWHPKAWHFEVIGDRNLDRATQMATQAAADLGVDIEVRLCDMEPQTLFAD